jgi:threonine dehydrogenase-like Zn-dependent dehydrogenase
MKSLICVEPGSFVYVEQQMPLIEPGYSLLKIKHIGVCGTDLHAFDGTQPFFTYPRVLGHELAAEYVSGDAPGISVGDLVTVIPYIHCTVCIACRAGKTNCCSSLKVCGVHVDGGMREFFKVPSNLVIKNNGLSLEQLALVEPLSIGAHAVERAAIQEGENILVMGGGPIGMGVVQFAILKKAHVILLDMNQDRLDFCLKHFPEVTVINGLKEDVKERLSSLTQGEMPAVVFDATGNLHAINNGFSLMSQAARYILVGLQLKEISLSHPEFHKREGTLMSSRNATKQDFEYVMDCISKGMIQPHNMITHYLEFDQVASEFKSLSDPAQKVMKALIKM